MKRIHLSCECKGNLPLIYGDRDRLRQVFINLISNAVKFSKENGQIRIEAVETLGGVLISVSNKRDRDSCREKKRASKDFTRLTVPLRKRGEGLDLDLQFPRRLSSTMAAGFGWKAELGRGVSSVSLFQGRRRIAFLFRLCRDNVTVSVVVSVHSCVPSATAVKCYWEESDCKCKGGRKTWRKRC